MIGADGYLRKPLSLAALVREIERLLAPGASARCVRLFP